MAKKSVGDLAGADLKGKKVFVRADLNVPLDDNQNITDDTRICAAVPTIKYLIANGAKVILSSHLRRPKGVTPKFSLAPLVPRLSELLGIEVVKADDCIGPEVEKLVASLPDGGVFLLENVRFYKEEEKNDPKFAKKLASLADLFVNDAFGTAHRAHASTEGVTKFLRPSVAGFLLQKAAASLSLLVVSSPYSPVGGLFSLLVVACSLSLPPQFFFHVFLRWHSPQEAIDISVANTRKSTVQIHLMGFLVNFLLDNLEKNSKRKWLMAFPLSYGF